MSRSAYDISTGRGPTNPRRQLVNATSYLDASLVYGVDPSRSSVLRTFIKGAMKVTDGDLLPLNIYDLPNRVPGPGFFEATDGLTSAPVQGEVRLHSYDVNGQAVDVKPFPTDTPTIVTLRAKRIFDPETKKWTDFEDPTGEVAAAGYAGAVLDRGY